MEWLNSWLIQFKPGKATTPPEGSIQTCCQAAYENCPYSVKVVAYCVYAYWSLCTVADAGFRKEGFHRMFWPPKAV